MGATSETVEQQLAREAWKLMFEFIRANSHRVMEVASEMSLTPGDMKSLMSLGEGHPLPMGGLAEIWNCDASNVTWLVDRLEERGYVERQVGTKDRRVKIVALTPAGIAARAAIHDRLFEPPEQFSELDHTMLTELVAILHRMVPPAA